MSISEIFDPTAWKDVPGFEDLTDITYHRAVDQGTVRIAFNRPEVRNAFRPHTVDELLRVLEHARTSSDVGCVLLTGNGPSPKDGGWAFCSGGDQRIRGKAGYQYAEGETAPKMMSIGMHCRLLGKPGRIGSLKRFLDYVQSHEKVWICRRIDIAQHWKKTHPFQAIEGT